MSIFTATHLQKRRAIRTTQTVWRLHKARGHVTTLLQMTGHGGH